MGESADAPSVFEGAARRTGMRWVLLGMALVSCGSRVTGPGPGTAERLAGGPGPAARTPGGPSPNPTAAAVAPSPAAAPPLAAHRSPAPRTANPNGASAASPSAAPAAPRPERTGDRPTPAEAASATRPAPERPVPAPTSASGILLGSFGTASGPIGAQLAAVQPAARAWVATVNAAGGLAGHPVRLIFDDDGAQPDRAIAIVRRMVEQQRVFAFYATQAVVTLQAVIPYLERAGVPVIGGQSSNPVEDTSPMVFNPQSGVAGASAGFTRALAAQTDLTKVAVLYCREVQVCTDYRDAVRRRARADGLEVVYEAGISLVQPDFTAEILNARQAGAEVLMPLTDYSSVIRVARSAHRQNWSPLLAQGYGVDIAEYPATGADVDGTVAFSLAANFQTSAAAGGYREAMRRYAPGRPTGGVGLVAWAQGKLLEAAATHLGEPPTRSQLIDGLYALRDETLGGLVPPITFQAGPHRATNRCVMPIKAAGGHWTLPLGEKFVCSTDAD